MRNTAIIWLVLAIFCSSSLFYVSQRTRDARHELSSLTKEIEEEKEALRVLRAEWSYLNNPQRLERLAKKYLKTDVIKLQQFVDEDIVEVSSSIVISPELLASPVARVAANKKRQRARQRREAQHVIKLKAKKLDLAKAKKPLPEEKDDDSIAVAESRRSHSFRKLIREWGNE